MLVGVEMFCCHLYLVVGLKREMGGDVMLMASLWVVTWVQVGIETSHHRLVATSLSVVLTREGMGL